jgi:hypothetical protein
MFLWQFWCLHCALSFLPDFTNINIHTRPGSLSAQGSWSLSDVDYRTQPAVVLSDSRSSSDAEDAEDFEDFDDADDEMTG